MLSHYYLIVVYLIVIILHYENSIFYYLYFNTVKNLNSAGINLPNVMELVAATNFSLTIDNREDNFGVPGIDTYTCGDLTYVHNGQVTSYKLEDCDEEGAFIELVPLVFDPEKQQLANHR